jgi:ATP-dependent RNA helicase RhlE
MVRIGGESSRRVVLITPLPAASSRCHLEDLKRTISMATFYRTPWKDAASGDYAAMNPHKQGGFRRNGPRPAGAGAPTSAPTGAPRFGRPSFSGSRSHSGSRPMGGSRGGYGRPSFGGSRGGNRGASSRGGSRGGERIDFSRFVNKANPVEDAAPFVPMHQFADFAIDARIKRNLADKGYTAPMPIQDQAIPAVLDGKDIVGLANTGTGKTGAFLIPLIQRVMQDPNMRVLIMAPTRELAVQINDEFRGFARTLSLHAAICVGGAGIMPQISALRHRPAFVIGTPGRLKDLMERRTLDLSSFNTVVLDEADRMLDMGFIQDMRFILAKMPNPRHTLFFSATLSRDIEKLIGEFLHDPVRVSVKTRDTAATIDQDVIRIGREESKFEVLVKLLGNPEFSKVLVFGRTKHGVERLARDLQHRGIPAEDIHGNKTYGKRIKALEMFKTDHVQVLVATDVAARGLDIGGVSHVINFDVPNTYDDYVHRIGRTGRAGHAGKALTFV